MSAPTVAYIAVVVDDPHGVAAFFECHLGLARGEVPAPGGDAIPWVVVGKSAIALFGPGHDFLRGATQSGVHHIAIAAPDPVARAEECGFTHVGETSGLGSGRQVELATQTMCGIATRLCEPIESGASGGTGKHVERIDHIGIASRDNRAVCAIFADQLGCPIESTETHFEISQPIESFISDKYGVVHHSRPPEAVGGLRVSFLTVGDCDLELLEPIDPRRADQPQHQRAAGPERGVPGSTRGDKNAIVRYIERHGPGLHHLALKTPDIDATLAHLANAGRRVIDQVGRPGSRAARIGFVHPESLGGLLLHFVERTDP